MAVLAARMMRSPQERPIPYLHKCEFSIKKSFKKYEFQNYFLLIGHNSWIALSRLVLSSQLRSGSNLISQTWKLHFGIVGTAFIQLKSKRIFVFSPSGSCTYVIWYSPDSTTFPTSPTIRPPGGQRIIIAGQASGGGEFSKRGPGRSQILS